MSTAIDRAFRRSSIQSSMWPWAHVATAYLLLTAACWILSRREPAGVEAVAVAVGALLPDLLDKPLAWRFAVLPHGRTFAHSLVIGGVVLVLVGYVARRYGQQRAFWAFAIGYLAHLAGDAYQPFLAGNWADLFFLAWPLTAAPTTGETVGVVAQLRQVEPTPFFLFGVAITLLGGVAWWFHGRPGIGTARGVLPSPRHR